MTTQTPVPAPTLKLTFSNKTSHAAENIHIGFVTGKQTDGTPNPMTITYGAENTRIRPVNVTLKNTYPFPGHWLSLKDLSDGATVTTFSGRIYVAYGPPWEPQAAYYEPGQAVTDPNFYLRYDKMEMTFTGQASDVANLTSIDYWSIPLSLTASKGGASVDTVSGFKGSTTANTIYTALTALTTPPVSGLPGIGGADGSPIPALVPGDFTQYGTGPAPGTAFARIIGPSSYPTTTPQGRPVLPYDTLQSYLQYLCDQFGPSTTAGAVVPTLGAGVIASVKGNFAGVGSPPPATGPASPQAYDLTATIDDSLAITLSGTCGGEQTTMVYQQSDLLNPSGIYGGNAAVSLNGATPPTPAANNVYGWISGDLMSGLNIGAVGSTTPSNGTGSTMVGALSSQEWFGLSESLFFDGLQQDNRYNQWAATLAPLSDAYNFAYSDRFAAVFASLNPATVDTLTLILENDTITA
jgi:hypothetical protein